MQLLMPDLFALTPLKLPESILYFAWNVKENALLSASLHLSIFKLIKIEAFLQLKNFHSWHIEVSLCHSQCNWKTEDAGRVEPNPPLYEIAPLEWSSEWSYIPTANTYHGSFST